ncbi:MAG: glycosyltransferase family 8 protein [Candidatus Saccharibacteria bacterium]|nr:glycosyltransferase family 8 protein [Candidatus Saccharibacteria bacterium]
MSIFRTGLPLDKYTKVVPVFLTINSSYAPYAAVSIHSLIQHSDKKRYYRIIILHDGLNLANRLRLRNLVTDNCAIQFKKITRSLYLKAVITYCSKRKGMGDFFSAAVYYYRFFIPLLFPRYEKAVYIDSDTILRGDIGELFDMELGDNVVMAMIDPKVTVIPEFRDYVDKAVGVSHDEYVNDGVMLMDLRKMRKMKYLSMMVAMIKKYDADLVAPDQDYLNVILKGKIGHFGSEWNAEPTEEFAKETKLVHFNLFNKPWHYKNVPGEKIFWNAARGTGFYGDLKRQQQAFDESKQKTDKEKVAALIEKAGILAEKKKILIKKVEK